MTLSLVKKGYESDHNIPIRNQFDVSEIVLKKQKQKIKTEIKLDTNIQIKLDVDEPDDSERCSGTRLRRKEKDELLQIFFNEEQ